MTDLVKVCEEWFPETKGFWMDSKLKQQLDILINNVTHDWDFTIIITAGGEVRAGKSVLGLQIGTYWSYCIEKVHKIKTPWDIKQNIIFQWQKLIETGNVLGEKHKYCAIQYDEAGETMEGSKSQTSELKAVRDYLRECGQYNFLNILVMPEFFDLPKGIAITRSTFLLDVYYGVDEKGIFQRGYFRFYSRKQKKRLYLEGKKELNYHAAPYNFDGEFRNFYPLDEIEYRKLKQEALKERETGRNRKYRIVIAALFYELRTRFKLNQLMIEDFLFKKYHLRMPSSTISDHLNSLYDERPSLVRLSGDVNTILTRQEEAMLEPAKKVNEKPKKSKQIDKRKEPEPLYNSTPDPKLRSIFPKS
jgi:hypothetical protein